MAQDRTAANGLSAALSSYFTASLYQVCSEKRRPRKRMEKPWPIFSFKRIKTKQNKTNTGKKKKE